MFCPESDRCNQFLGMTDNSIGDFQISSSSSRINFPPRNSRPYSTGWCANENDDKPYVQVILFVYSFNIEFIKHILIQTSLTSCFVPLSDTEGEVGAVKQD